jgi:hypothetical protein
MGRHGARPTALAAALAAALTVLATVLAPLTATASQADTGPAPRSVRLTLTVTEGEPSSLFARAVSLRCRPTGGTHPAADDVCAALVVVDGELHMAGMPSDLVCPLHYQPVTVTASGTADGMPVAHRRTYPNACVLHSETGPLFEF